MPIAAYYAPWFEVITGAHAFQRGQASSIAGLETPDPYTVVFHLTAPTGDFGARLALPQTAPIPPSPRDPSARLGAAHGHDTGYGRFLVASGPYMIAGSERLDFHLPAAAQRPVSGWVTGRFAPHHGGRLRKVPIGPQTLTLVRNPAWNSSNDPLRPALPDRIVVRLGAGPASGTDSVLHDRTDVLLGQDAKPADLRRARALGLGAHVLSAQQNLEAYLFLNVATPPFDNLHVRRAVAYAFNKARLVRIDRAANWSSPAGHLLPDSLEQNRLAGYDPLYTTGASGDLARARAEMRRSPYDHNHDGRCDGAVCRVRYLQCAPAADVCSTPFRRSVAHDLARIGVTLDVRHRDPSVPPGREWTSAHAQLTLSGWFPDFLSGQNFFDGLFAGETGSLPPRCCNYSLLGASPGALRAMGYPARAVPSFDAKLDQCRALVGEAQTACWAEADKRLLNGILPAVPALVYERRILTGRRVLTGSVDQSVGSPEPALDRFTLRQRSG